MCKASPCNSAGQDGVFHVVLLDAKGNEQGYIGYRFGAAGAQAAANSWNAQADREVTAVIRDGLPVAKAEQPAAKRLSITTGKAELFVLPSFCSEDDLEFYRDLLSDAEQIDIVTDCAANAEEAPSNALDERGEQDDSDVEDDTENATSDELEGSSFDDDELNIKQTLFDMVDAAQLAADRGDLSLMGSLGLRYTLVRYLQSVIGVVVDNKVRHTSDIGMIAKGLELFCARVIDGNETATECDSFGFGQDGSISNDYGTMEALQEWIDNATASAVPA